MKRWIALAVLFSGWAFVPCIQAQEHRDSLNHVEVGAFGELVHLNQTSSNLGGLGARLSVNVASHLQLEAEAGYDFSRVFTENFTNSSGSVTAVNSNVRVFQGLFWPEAADQGPGANFRNREGRGHGFHV